MAKFVILTGIDLLFGEITLGKKPTSQELSTKFIELADKISLAEEPLAENKIWQDRMREVIDHLPSPIVSNLVERMQIAARDECADTQYFAKIHGLTPAEEKLLISLSDGLTVPEHANNLGIAVNTGRVHMQRILDKTSASGQLDLIKMLNKR